MIRSFVLLSLLIFGLCGAMLLHWALSPREALQERIDRTAAVTGLASPALHAAWYEPRLRRFEARINPSYPELLPPDRLSFVYGELYGK